MPTRTRESPRTQVRSITFPLITVLAAGKWRASPDPFASIAEVLKFTKILSRMITGVEPWQERMAQPP